MTNLIQPRTIGSIKKIHRRQPLSRVGSHHRQHSLHTLDQSLDRGGVEHVGAELDRSVDPGRSAGIVEAFSQREHQIHTGRAGLRLQSRHADVTQCQRGSWVAVLPWQVLPGQHHLYEWMMGKTPSRVEPIHQHLERHVLMLERRQATLPHLAQQVGNRGVPSQVHAQHQGVDEEAHQLVQCGLTASSRRDTHGHIGARAQSSHQRRQRRLDHHEAGRAVLPGHAGDLLLQFGRPLHRHTGALVVGHRRIRPVGRQLHPIGQTGQLALPIAQLVGDHTVGVRYRTQPLLLPEGEVDILHRQRFPSGGVPGAPTGVGGRQVHHQRCHRPAVRGDVVYDRRQYVLILADTEKRCLDRYFTREVETVACCRADLLVEPGRRPSGGIDDLPSQISLLDAENHLLRYPVNRGEHGAQGLLPAHHIRQCSTQGIFVEVPAEA
nr:hypothetical protein CPGR_00517 [Mycolicibacterium fortuitum subsp. fortuitum DSM 46621 = ATCC 6841 = JCM 6387]CRL82852.1 hypothetical protein CPGR_06079 [Mycolicibacter nonchromogenicus]